NVNDIAEVAFGAESQHVPFLSNVLQRHVVFEQCNSLRGQGAEKNRATKSFDRYIPCDPVKFPLTFTSFFARNQFNTQTMRVVKLKQFLAKSSDLFNGNMMIGEPFFPISQGTL